MQVYLRLSAVVAGLLGAGFVLPAIARQPQPEPAAVAKAPTPAKPKLTVKVFKLERAEPGAVIEAMSSLLGDADIELPPPAAPMQPGGVILVLPGFGGQLGFGGQIGLGGGGLGNLGCGFNGINGINGNGTTPAWRATGDERTGSLVVRGSENHIKIAADVVALLDRKPKAPLPKLQVVKAFSLKHADAGSLSNAIELLGFDEAKTSILSETLLAVVGPDDVTGPIAELVKELDVPGRPERKDGAPNAER